MDNNIEKEFIGNYIRTQRNKLNLSQEKFSELIDISNNYLSDIENGKANFTYDVLCKILKTLNISKSHIFILIEHGKIGDEIFSLLEKYKNIPLSIIEKINSLMDEIKNAIKKEK